MSFSRGIDGSEPLRPEPLGRLSGTEEIRRATRTTILGSGTLACPSCDAPVSPGPHRLAPASALSCPFCGHAGRTRDFLTLGEPTRPAHVVIKVTGPSQIRIHGRRG